MKLKIDRDRGTNPAKGVSLDLSDDGISKPEQRLSALDGESIRRDVPSNDMIAYMAGLFDGEGCVTYKKYWSNKSFGSYLLQLVQTIRTKIQNIAFVI